MENNILINLKKECYKIINKITQLNSDDFREGQVDGIFMIIHIINKKLEENGQYKEE